MRSLLVYLWIGAAVFSCSPNDVLAKKEHYADSFSKAAVFFDDAKDLKDPAEIRQKHIELIKIIGNFSQDPCKDFFKYAVEGYLSTTPEEEHFLMMTEYDFEVFKYYGEKLLKSGILSLHNLAQNKAAQFYGSCLGYTPSDQDLPPMVAKMYEIVERSANWREAYLGLHAYGIDLFWEYSIDKKFVLHKPTEFLSSKSFGDLKKAGRIISQIINETESYMDEKAQKVWEFKEHLEGLGNPDTINTPDIFKLPLLIEYPALHIAEILLPLYGPRISDDISADDPAYLADLNKLLEKTDEATIKAYMVFRAYEHLKEIQDSFRNSNTTCYNEAFEYFEPALRSLFMSNYLSYDDMITVRSVLREQVGFIRGYYRDAGALDMLASFDNTYKEPQEVIDLIYLDLEYLESLYTDLQYDIETGFLEKYFDTVYNHNKVLIKCIANLKVGNTRPEFNYPDKMKPHQICRTGDRPFSLPLRHFTIPFYNSAYPKYWSYGSLLWANIYNFLLPQSPRAVDLWKILAEFYKDDIHSAEALLGYEELNLTTAQMYHLARVQGAIIQGNGWKVLDLEKVNKDPEVLRAFKCTV